MTTPSNPAEKFIGIALLALAGMFIWVLHFAVVYAAQHMLCVTLGERAGFWVETSIIVITATALAVLAVLIFKPDIALRLDTEQGRPERTRQFISGIIRLLALLSFFAVLWSGIAMFFLPACGSLN
jgi:hypothetical protein